jgi:DNA-binding CsgD family transcriptional regulator
MQLVPLRVQEGEVWVTSGRFDLRDNQDVSLSFVGVPPAWAEIDNGLQIHCKAVDLRIAVRLEAWMDEPPGHEEQWDERSELLIDWTSGWVWLDACDGTGPDLEFFLGPSALSTAYRLRVSRQVRPGSDGATENASWYAQGISPHQERYLFQFWPVPLAPEMVEDSEASETELEGLPSSREKAILTFIARGDSDREIARQLQISLRTVKTSIASIQQKLEASDRTAALVHALRRGWISME